VQPRDGLHAREQQRTLQRRQRLHVGDTCSGGICAGAPANCNDNNGCTDDGCNPATGCTHVSNNDPCNDGNACTTDDTCAGGACVGGAAPDCNDGDVCTNDTCNPASGCSHSNNTAPCSDDNECTTNDHCSGGICVGGPAPNCNDGTPVRRTRASRRPVRSRGHRRLLQPRFRVRRHRPVHDQQPVRRQ
jgi:hypothetical protein